MHFYRAYGLRIRSALPLPELRSILPFDDEADLVITPLSAVPDLPDAGGPGLFVGYAEGAVVLRWPYFGTYLVREGRRIEYAPAPGVSVTAARVPLLGVCMGLLLHQRTLLTLHASAVSVGGGAIAFVGEKGAGKSTVTAALVERGFGLLSDDVTALSIEGKGAPTVLPGIEAIKLWPDSLEAIGIDPATVPTLHEKVEKCVFQPSDAESCAQALRCIYVIEPGEQVGSASIPMHQAFSELVRHTYAARFLGDAVASPTHFQQCASVLRTTAVRRLVRPKNMAHLRELIDFIETELGQESTF